MLVFGPILLERVSLILRLGKKFHYCSSSKSVVLYRRFVVLLEHPQAIQTFHIAKLSLRFGLLDNTFA